MKCDNGILPHDLSRGEGGERRGGGAGRERAGERREGGAEDRKGVGNNSHNVRYDREKTDMYHRLLKIAPNGAADSWCN